MIEINPAVTKYFVDASGTYLGGFQGVKPTIGAVEVPTVPFHAKDKWNGTGWVPDAAVQKEGFNAPIIEQIASLDTKRIRPLVEGDTVFLAKLNEQIIELRAQLRK